MRPNVKPEVPFEPLSGSGEAAPSLAAALTDYGRAEWICGHEHDVDDHKNGRCPSCDAARAEVERLVGRVSADAPREVILSLLIRARPYVTHAELNAEIGAAIAGARSVSQGVPEPTVAAIERNATIGEWVTGLPTDAISQVLRAVWDVENDTTLGAEWRVVRDRVFREALLSLIGDAP